MCLILFGYRVHPQYELIIAANRDEFYERPTLRAGWWEENPSLLAGKDLKAGGTWLGLSKNGRFSAITNFREPFNIKPDAPSRGALVTDFLAGDQFVMPYQNELRAKAADYNGFNLLTYDGENLGWFSNRGELGILLTPGIYGLSNHLLDTAWPKVRRGKQDLSQIISPQMEIDTEALFFMMENETRAPDHELPQTGVSPEWEKILSAMCIKSPSYGTRVTTVILLDKKGKVFFEERSRISAENPVKFEFHSNRIFEDSF
ncbi:MAG: NRDE family protein [Bacteroidia bacterium]|nr:NRDE family protein [Bacteroidia bacterium]